MRDVVAVDRSHGSPLQGMDNFPSQSTCLNSLPPSGARPDEPPSPNGTVGSGKSPNPTASLSILVVLLGLLADADGSGEHADAEHHQGDHGRAPQDLLVVVAQVHLGEG